MMENMRNTLSGGQGSRPYAGVFRFALPIKIGGEANMSLRRGDR
jgi:hypothetical protein